MGQRKANEKLATRLSIKKETLRALQDRTLTDEDLRAVAGGWFDRTDYCAPSCRGC